MQFTPRFTQFIAFLPYRLVSFAILLSTARQPRRAAGFFLVLS